MSSIAKHTLLAIGVAAASFWALPAQAGAAFSVNSHFLSADTSVSDRNRSRADALDDVRFDGALVSEGLGAQGAVGSATASQSALFDAQHGASGHVESALVLGTGITGGAESTLFVGFDLAELSSFVVSGSSQTDGNAFSVQRLRLLLDAVDGSLVEVFAFDFSAPTVSLSGFLNPGRYLFDASTVINSADPGEDGRGRIDFDFRFDTVTGGNAIPEPSSLALAVAALALVARGRRRPTRR